MRATTRSVKHGNEGGIAGEPLLACWLDEQNAREGRRVLTQAGIASFEKPEDTVIVGSYLGEWSRVQRALLRMPSSQGEDTANEKAA